MTLVGSVFRDGRGSTLGSPIPHSKVESNINFESSNSKYID